MMCLRRWRKEKEKGVGRPSTDSIEDDIFMRRLIVASRKEWAGSLLMDRLARPPFSPPSLPSLLFIFSLPSSSSSSIFPSSAYHQIQDYAMAPAASFSLAL